MTTAKRYCASAKAVAKGSKGALKLVLQAYSPADDDGPDYPAGWVKIELSPVLLERILRLHSVTVSEDVWSITDRQDRFVATWEEDTESEVTKAVLNVGHGDCWFDVAPDGYVHGLVTDGAPVEVLECIAKGTPLPKDRTVRRGELLFCADDKGGLKSLLEDYDEAHKNGGPREAA